MHANKRPLSILQLASFKGNIGDNANHYGTRKVIQETLSDYEVSFTNLEIRDFFRKERFYDDSFVDYVNTFDLLLFGGGNYFELWVDHACNNTSVDLSIQLLEKIKTPIIFYALGLDVGLGYTEKGILKFKSWLDYINSNDRFLLSLRNDGSLDTAKRHLGEEYAKHFHSIPDGGFFLDTTSQNNIEVTPNEMNIGVNIAGDILDLRFSDNAWGFDDFLNEMSKTITTMISENPKTHFILYAHIYKDYDVYRKLLKMLPDKIVRSQIKVAPYVQEDRGCNYIFESYKKCDIILGNRFHANVCSIAQEVPALALTNYSQVQYLYEELDLKERLVFINKPSFSSEKFIETIKYTISSRERINIENKDRKRRLRTQLQDFWLTVSESLLHTMIFLR